MAARFGVSVSNVFKARQRRGRHGKVSVRPQASRTPRLLAGLHGAIVAHVRTYDEATLDGLQAWLREAHGMSVSMGLMWNTLARLGLTLKKSLRAAEQAYADVAAAREALRAVQPGLKPERLVFIDDTWTKTNMARQRGRGPRGQRVIGAVPHGH